MSHTHEPLSVNASGLSPGCSCYSSCRMRTKAGVFRPILYAVVIGGLAPAMASAQHVHGVIELGVVVEGGEVAVSLSAPMHDVVGFEHAPEGDDQIQKVRQAAEVLSSSDEMFGLPVAANCEASHTSIEGPGFVMDYIDSAHAGHEEHDDHHDDHHSEEVDHDGEVHSEVNATYEWTCGDASNLDALDLRFMDSFSGVEKIDVQVLTPDGATVITVEGEARQVSLVPR